MKRMLLLAALCVPAAAQAQVVVRAPGVYVEVGGAVVVRAFGVQVVVPRRAAKPPAMVPAADEPAPRPADPAVPPADPAVPPVPREEERLLPAPVPAAPARAVRAVPVRAVTPGDFVAGAKPFRAGPYEVVFVHPHTGKPITVNFELPVPPRRVSVTRTRIDFYWGPVQGISLYFEPDGSVRVKGVV